MIHVPPLPESIRRGDWAHHDSAAYFSGVFSRHVKGLHVVTQEKGEIQQYLFTGSLLNLNGTCFWMTAGHVVDNLREIVMADSVLEGAQILDGYPKEGANAVPLPLSELELLSCDEDGFDLGCIPMPNWFAQTLDTNPYTKMLDPSAWNGHAKANAEAFYLVGMPSEWNDFREELTPGKTYASVNAIVACVPIRLTPDRPEDKHGTFWGKKDVVYAEVLECQHDDGRGLESLNGTSGGLIFGVRRMNGGLRYWLYGVQSSWLPKRRILRATDIGVLDGIVKRERADAAK